jgi:glucokinase
LNNLLDFNLAKLHPGPQSFAIKQCRITKRFEDMGYPRLLGDVGGTNARWAWQDAPGNLLTNVSTYPCADFPSIHQVISHYLAQHRLPAPHAVAFGTANPVTGDFVRMTNHHWQFSISELKHQIARPAW